jgi:GNAT superfamily N-acetyltransferase
MTTGRVTPFKGASAPAAALVHCIAHAFATYNGWEWLLGRYAGSACSTWLLQHQIAGILGNPAATAYAIPFSCDGDPVGVVAAAFLIRCESASRRAAPSLADKLRIVWNLGLRLMLRLKRFSVTVDELHEQAGPMGPHFMISLVGVVPHMQGRGFASQLMRAVLAAVDAEGLPCYLFTANDTNEAMYAKLGFVTQSRRSMGVHVDGPHAGDEMTIRSMLRPPGAASVR